MVMEGVAKAVVGRHASCHSHVLDAGLLYGELQLLHQNVHDGVLQAGCEVFLVMLNEVWVVLNPFAQTVEE